MTFADIIQVFQLVAAHKWLLLAVFAVSWVTALTNDWSKFPITVPDYWRPVVVISLGLISGVLTSWNELLAGGLPWKDALGQAAWKAAVVTGGAFTLFAVLVKAIYKGEPPPWLRFIAFAKKQPPAGG